MFSGSQENVTDLFNKHMDNILLTYEDLETYPSTVQSVIEKFKCGLSQILSYMALLVPLETVKSRHDYFLFNKRLFPSQLFSASEEAYHLHCNTTTLLL